MALRQKAFDMEYAVQVTNLACGGSPAGDGSPAGSKGGVTVYGTESEHYDLFLLRTETGCQAVLKLNIGGIRHEQAVLPLDGNTAELVIRSTSTEYQFFVRANGEEHFLGAGQSKFLSNEVSTTFTGVMLGLFAQGEGEVRFDQLHIHYTF